MVIADTNILVRCVRGKAMRRAQDLIARGITVATTENNADELWRVLVGKLGMEQEQAASDVALALDPLLLLGWDDYGHRRADAAARLRDGGQSDWPALAAAMVFDASIWSDDVDYFGVGVPVWSTPNVHLIAFEGNKNG